MQNKEAIMQKIHSLCPYCGCGCSLYLNVENNNVVGVTADKQDPLSEGKPCIKGLNSHQFIYSKDRIKTPLIRKNNKLKPATWEEAYKFIHKNLKNFGPADIAFLGSSPSTNEDNFLLQKFARDVFKTNNIDSCARICHAATCYAFMHAFGISAMPSKITDYEDADCILIIGSDPRITYPIAFNKILKAKTKGAKLICVHDWKNETSQFSDLYIQILDGTELAFLNGILHILVKDYNLKITKELNNVINKYTKEKVSEICKTKKENIQKVADLIAKSKKFVLGFGMGLTQHIYGVNNAFAAINLVLAKNGKIISMRGKANIQGVGDMGCLPREGVETIISSMFLVPVKALYIMEMNPAQSLPYLNKVHEKLREIFIIQHTSFPNETTKFADVVLPCCTWAEHDGSFTNAESRVRYFEKAIDPLFESKPNWKIITELAKYFNKNYKYDNIFDIWNSIKKEIPEYSNIDITKLKKHISQFPNRPAKYKKFHPVEFEKLEEPTSEKYPFILTTERTMYNFCTGDMSRRSVTLKKLEPEARCLINRSDARKLNLKDNNPVKIYSKSGSIRIKVKITKNVPKNLLVVPFHFDEVLVNKVIPLEFGPIVEEANLKRVAVNLVKI